VTEQPEIAVVTAVYDAFARADVTAVLELFAPDCVVYQSPLLPWGGRHTGHDGLLAFLVALSSAISSVPEHEHLVADGDGHVSQVGRTRGTATATGASFDLFENHVWTVRDGRVTRFEIYLDTVGMLAALG
jgi:ketosteroid isomerase-like protein